MTAQALIEEAVSEGVTLAVTERGTIKVSGDHAVLERWTPILREHKPAILAALQKPPLSADDEAAIRGWLSRIGEFDPEQIASALRVCRGDEPSRRWCLALARGYEPQRH